MPPGSEERVELRCRSCGVEFVAVDPTARPRRRGRKPARPERILVDESGVLVTSTRFAAPGFALPVENVIRCGVEPEPGRWVWPRESLLALLGALGLFGVTALPGVLALDAKAPLFGRLLGFAVAAMLLALGGGVAHFGWQSRYYRLERYHLVVVTTGGDIRAFSDADEDFVTRVAEALTEAVNAREE